MLDVPGAPRPHLLPPLHLGGHTSAVHHVSKRGPREQAGARAAGAHCSTASPAVLVRDRQWRGTLRTAHTGRRTAWRKKGALTFWMLKYTSVPEEDCSSFRRAELLDGTFPTYFSITAENFGPCQPAPRNI